MSEDNAKMILSTKANGDISVRIVPPTKAKKSGKAGKSVVTGKEVIKERKARTVAAQEKSREELGQLLIDFIYAESHTPSKNSSRAVSIDWKKTIRFQQDTLMHALADHPVFGSKAGRTGYRMLTKACQYAVAIKFFHKLNNREYCLIDKITAARAELGVDKKGKRLSDSKEPLMNVHRDCVWKIISERYSFGEEISPQRVADAWDMDDKYEHIVLDIKLRYVNLLLRSFRKEGLLDVKDYTYRMAVKKGGA